MKPSTSSLPPKIFPTIIHSFFAIFHSSSSPLNFFPKIIHFLSLPLQLNRPKPNSNSSIDAVSCQQITTQSTDFYVILQAIFRVCSSILFVFWFKQMNFISFHMHTFQLHSANLGMHKSQSQLLILIMLQNLVPFLMGFRYQIYYFGKGSI